MAQANEHILPTRTYVLILAALLLLLVMTTWFGFIDFDRFLPGHKGWSTGIALSIAILKAVLVIMFFMHVRYASRITWVFAAAGFLWLGILLQLTLSDYLTRNNPPGTNPKGEPHFLLPPSGLAETSSETSTEGPREPLKIEGLLHRTVPAR